MVEQHRDSAREWREKHTPFCAPLNDARRARAGGGVGVRTLRGGTADQRRYDRQHPCTEPAAVDRSRDRGSKAGSLQSWMNERVTTGTESRLSGAAVRWAGGSVLNRRQIALRPDAEVGA
jgi:hypothetical protein